MANKFNKIFIHTKMCTNKFILCTNEPVKLSGSTTQTIDMNI